MESKLIKEFYSELKAAQNKKAAIKQRLKIALIIGGIIICLMLMIS